MRACVWNFMSPIILDSGCTPSVIRSRRSRCGSSIAGSNPTPRKSQIARVVGSGSPTRSSNLTRSCRSRGMRARKPAMFSWSVIQSISGYANAGHGQGAALEASVPTRRGYQSWPSFASSNERITPFGWRTRCT